ncbi:hypothetical protein F3X89_22190 [Rhizobium rhizogenes]|nr:hypothetical protein F3X89_22190 [Rhizobium rhizogenes]
MGSACRLPCSRHLSRSQAEIPLILGVRISRATSLSGSFITRCTKSYHHSLANQKVRTAYLVAERRMQP